MKQYYLLLKSIIDKFEYFKIKISQNDSLYLNIRVWKFVHDEKTGSYHNILVNIWKRAIEDESLETFSTGLFLLPQKIEERYKKG